MCRAALGIGTGARVTFLVDGSNVKIINSALYAMELQLNQMAGEAHKAGLKDDEDAIDLVKSFRSEDAQ